LNRAFCEKEKAQRALIASMDRKQETVESRMQKVTLIAPLFKTKFREEEEGRKAGNVDSTDQSSVLSINEQINYDEITEMIETKSVETKSFRKLNSVVCIPDKKSKTNKKDVRVQPY
jgi:hypothetical protein